MYLGNTPDSSTTLMVESAKSFALGLWIRDEKGRPCDLTGCTLTIVAKTSEDLTADDGSNLLVSDAVANIPLPKKGYAKFSIQAASLKLAAGEYPYAIVMIDWMSVGNLVEIRVKI